MNSLLKGWEERIAADPQFTYKVFVEQVLRAPHSWHLSFYCGRPADCVVNAGDWRWSGCRGRHVFQTLLGPVRAGLCLLHHHCEPQQHQSSTLHVAEHCNFPLPHLGAALLKVLFSCSRLDLACTRMHKA